MQSKEKQHVNFVCTKANRSLGLIFSDLFFTIIGEISLLPFRGVSRGRYLLERILNTQTRFVRLVCLSLGFRYFEVPLQTLASDMVLQPLLIRRRIIDLMFLYKLINGEVQCSELPEQINIHVPDGTRSRDLFAIAPWFRSKSRETPFLLRSISLTAVPSCSEGRSHHFSQLKSDWMCLYGVLCTAISYNN
ncbi:hypothetical protein J6590_091849 [Homalodisca vitripennis]|nr:hypothetical protein J6590_091849 [Homalodisca vitripennis]